MNFSKYHGLGNDFIIIDRRGNGPLSSVRCEALCDRRRGIGADGVIALMRDSPNQLLKMHITNSDGSVPEMCGNGLRCLARFVVDELELERREIAFDIDTDAGVHRVKVLADDVEVVFPGPKFHDDELCAEGAFIDKEHIAAGETYRGTFVSTGNPHFVVMKAISAESAEIEGPRLQASPLFLKSANIGFCEIENDSRIRLVVYERGAGLTQACGTGALAAVSALVKNQKMPSETDVCVRLLGGDLFISVAADFKSAIMRGPARFVFTGHYSSDLDSA